jgi:hypothetical protein
MRKLPLLPLLVLPMLAFTAAGATAAGTKPCTVEPCPTAVPASWKANAWRSQLGYTHCAYDGRTVRCMTTSGKHAGRTLVVGRRRAWRGEPGSVTYSPAGLPILRWGSYHDFGPYRCTARRTGMTCVNTRRRSVALHGFSTTLRFSYTW